jgi:glycosyltransferase involved in cell wall biosynthesis
LFPEVPDWKAAAPRVSHLRRFGRLAVTSNEMLGVMDRLGLEAVKVNTRSLLPLRDPGDIGTEGLRVFTRAQEYPRKNLSLFRALQGSFAGEIERFDAVVGSAVLPQAGYVDLIDAHNCYVCTSWQEGGPLPLMDALRRGCVVLTTRVGQTDEWVEDGGNGFFCSNEAEFAMRLRELRDDPRRLREMRLRALARAAERDDAGVRAQLEAFLP